MTPRRGSGVSLHLFKTNGVKSGGVGREPNRESRSGADAVVTRRRGIGGSGKRVDEATDAFAMDALIFCVCVLKI